MALLQLGTIHSFDRNCPELFRMQQGPTYESDLSHDNQLSCSQI